MRSSTYPHVVQFETRTRLVTEAIAHERELQRRARPDRARTEARRDRQRTLATMLRVRRTRPTRDQPLLETGATSERQG
jgi:hypothetical protein